VQREDRVAWEAPEQSLVRHALGAAASRVAVWPSWPQACIVPWYRLAWGRPVASTMGSASMSARMPRLLLPLQPWRSQAITPVSAWPRYTS